MKKLLRVLLFLLVPISVNATTTVTGNLQNLGTATVGQGAYVRFWLRGCGGNIPRVNGTALIAPSQGGVYYFDIAATSGGVISGTLYSTRDSTGLLGGDIECGGIKTAVWYGMQVYVGGKGGVEIPIHAKSGVTLDITQVGPITVTPPIPASGLAAGTVPDLIQYSGPASASDSGIPSTNVPQKSTDNAFSNSDRFKGPVPWRDVSAYMPSGGCSSTDTSSTVNTTGTISLGTPTTLTVAAAKDFKNGCGIAILGAGPLPTIVTPPSTLSISSVTHAAGVVTITTTGNHNIPTLPGGQSFEGIVVSGCTTDTTPNGTFPIATVPDGTHLTFAVAGSGSPTGCSATVMFGYAHGTTGSTTYKYQIVAIDGLMGVTAPSSQFSVTSGNATLSKYNYNQLFWACGNSQCSPSLPQNGSPYMWAIYSDKGLGGALSCVGTSLVNAFSDQGFNYGGCPSWVPSAPGSAVAEVLTTTISAGGGTTALTLANAATTAVTSNGVLHDESSFLTSCINDAANDQKIPTSQNGSSYGCYLPAGNWWFTTFVTPAIAPNTNEMRIRVAGNLVLHEMPLYMLGGFKLESVGGGGGGGNFDSVSQTNILLNGVNNMPAAIAAFGGGNTINGFTVNFPGQDVFWIDALGSSGIQLLNDFVSMGNANFGSAIHIENLIGGKLDTLSLNSGTGGGQQLIDFAISQYNGASTCCVNISNMFTNAHGVGFRSPGGSSGNCNNNTIAITNWLMENEDPLDNSMIQVDSGPNSAGPTCSSVTLVLTTPFVNISNSDIAQQYNNLFGILGTATNSVTNPIMVGVAVQNMAVCVNVIATCGANTGNQIIDVSSLQGPQKFGPFSKASDGFAEMHNYGFPQIGSANVSFGPLAIWNSQSSNNSSAGFAMMLPAPSNVTVTGTGAGSLAAATYCMGFTGLDNRTIAAVNGETNLSNIVCQNVGASSSITLQGKDGWGGNMLFAYSDKNFYYCVVSSGSFCDPNQNTAGSPSKKIAALGIGAGSPFTYVFTSTAAATSVVPPANTGAMLSWLGWDYLESPSSCFYCTLSHSDAYPVGFGIIPTVNAGYNIYTKLGLNVGTNGTFGGSVTTTGTTAGLIGLTGATSNPAIPSNSAGYLGPPSASFTSYVVQLPSTAPSGGQVLQAATPASNISTGTWVTSPVTVASGVAAMSTTALGAAGCETAVTVSASGVATTDTITWAFNADPGATTGYSTGILDIYAYPTANNVNFRLCASAAVTPGAATLNWRVVR